MAAAECTPMHACALTSIRRVAASCIFASIKPLSAGLRHPPMLPEDGKGEKQNKAKLQKQIIK